MFKNSLLLLSPNFILMEFTAQQIADFLHGVVEGNPNEPISNFARIEEGHKGAITFLANPKYTHYIYETKASVVLVNKDFKPDKPVRATMIRVENAYECLAKLLQFAESQKKVKTGISSLACISETAKIGANVYIAPFVYIGERVTIGDNTRIYPHVFIDDDTHIGSDCKLFAGVKVHDRSQIGNRCILQAGAVIGSDGFGFSPTGDGTYDKIPQSGNVVLEDDVEIQANTTVDRATIGSTVIHKGVKLDNLIQVAHNVEIGENTVIAAQTGIAGSTKIGKSCVVAGQVGFAGHITIGDNNSFGAQTGIPNHIKTTGQIYQGYPALPISTFRRSSIVFKNLADLQKTVFELQKQLAELQAKNS